MQGIAHRHQDAFGRSRLDEEVLGAGLHRLNDCVDTARSRQHDGRRANARGANFLERIDSRLARHDKIEDQGVDARRRGQPVDRLTAVFGVQDGEAFALEHGLNQPALRRIVVANQDRFGHSDTHLSSRKVRPLFCNAGLFWDKPKRAR